MKNYSKPASTSENELITWDYFMTIRSIDSAYIYTMAPIKADMLACDAK